MSPLFDTPTFSIVPAKGKMTVNYFSFLAQVPEDFGGVRDIQLAKNEILIQGSGRRSVAALARHRSRGKRLGVSDLDARARLPKYLLTVRPVTSV